MRNVETWAPSKFVFKRGRLRASSSPKESGPGSRLMCDLIASCYHTHVKRHCRGRLLLNVPFFYWLHEEPYDYYRYTKYALRRFAEATGFDIILIKELGGAPEIVVDILSKFISRLGPIGAWTAVVLQAACRRLVASPLWTRVSERTAKQFPLGYFLIARRLGDSTGTCGPRSWA